MQADMISSMTGLGWYWLALPLAAAVLGIAVVLHGLLHAAHGRPVRASAHLATGAPLALVGLALSLIGVNAQSFARLTYETPIAEVAVHAVDARAGLYDVTVTREDANTPPQTCRLEGDAWEMSAVVQKWQPWANVLGLDTTYQLDQLSNRYRDAERANGKTITACDLKGPPPKVNALVPQSWLFWILDQAYVQQRRFGSAAYMPLADGAVYNVIMTQSGLNAEAQNDAAKTAVAGMGR